MHSAKASAQKTHIAGVLVQVHPEHITQVRNRLADVAEIADSQVVHDAELELGLSVTLFGGSFDFGKELAFLCGENARPPPGVVVHDWGEGFVYFSPAEARARGLAEAVTA